MMESMTMIDKLKMIMDEMDESELQQVMMMYSPEGKMPERVEKMLKAFDKLTIDEQEMFMRKMKKHYKEMH